MTWVAPNLIYTCSVILMLVPILADLQMSNATTPSENTAVVVAVNRTAKKDRMPLVGSVAVTQPLRINDLIVPTSDYTLVDGCESLVSPLSRSSLAQIAGRCLS